MCTTVSFLHGLDPVILHKDIKSENVLVNMHGQTKLCDFGLAKSEDMGAGLSTAQGEEVTGTSFHMALELILDNASATTKTDIWSLGCVIVELYSDKSVWQLPMKSISMGICHVLSKQMISKKKPSVEQLPKTLQKIILRCFDYCDANRPRCSSLLDVLKCLDDSESD